MRETDLELFAYFAQFLAGAYVNAAIFIRSMHQTKTIQDVVRDLDVGAAISNIIETTCQLLHCDRATLFMVDPTGKYLWIRAAKGIGDIRLPLSKNSLAGSVAITGVVLNIEDAYDDSRFNPSIDVKTGYRTKSVLCVPVKNENGNVVAVLQAINKFRPGQIGEGISTVVPFDRRDDFEAQMLASIAGIVLRNALVFKAAMNSRNKMNMLLSFSRKLNSQRTLNDLIMEMQKEAKTLVNSDKCTVFFLDTNTNELWSKGKGKGEEEIRFPASTGLAGHVATKLEMLNIPDAYKDPRFNRNVDKMTKYKTKSILAVPIVSADGESLGCIQAINKLDGDAFTKQDEELVSAFSAQAAVSMLNSRNRSKLMELQKYFRNKQAHSTNTNFSVDFNAKGRIIGISEVDTQEMLGIAREQLMNKTYGVSVDERSTAAAEDSPEKTYILNFPSNHSGMAYVKRRARAQDQTRIPEAALLPRDVIQVHKLRRR